MIIELPGYRTVFPNEVYAVDRTMTPAGGEPVEMSHILLLRRYTDPSEEDVLSLITRKAEELEPAASLLVPGTPGASPGRTLLEDLIINLPSQSRMRLRTRNSDFMTFIRMNTPAPSLGAGEMPLKYASVSYGFVRKDFVDRSTAEITSREWYEKALQHPAVQQVGHGEQWRMTLLLSDGVLPPKEDIDTLIGYGSSMADIFTITRRRYDKQQVREIVNTIYSGLASSDSITALPDVSAKMVEQAAIPAIVALHKYLERLETERQQQRQQPRASGLVLPGMENSSRNGGNGGSRRS